MHHICVLIATGSLLLVAPAASAALATLEIAIGSWSPLQISGSSPGNDSAGAGGAATLPAGALSGVFVTGIAPPWFDLFDGIALAAPGFPFDGGPFTNPPPATNGAFSFDGTTGTTTARRARCR